MRGPILAFAIFTSLACGCSDPARPHLEELVRQMALVVGKPYTELETYTGEERKIRYLYRSSEAWNDMLTEYLQTDRPISDDLKDFLNDWRELTARSMALHGKMISENRFTYIDEEEEEASRRLAEAEALAGMEFLHHLEGY